MTTNKDNIVLEQFVSELRKVPWFEFLGRPLQFPKASYQIHSWSEWLGPEQPSVVALNERQQALCDELTNSGQSEDRVAIWNRIQSIVFRDAMAKIPYDSKKDTWHAPNAALWHAAWTAGLVGLCRIAHRSIPDEIDVQWQWFKCGHWPCDWDDESGMAIVF